MPATISAAGRVDRPRARGIHAPQRVRQVLGEAEHLVHLPGRVDRGNRVAIREAIRTCNAPSGSVTPGKIRAPLETTLSAPSTTPSPITLIPSITQWSPIVAPAATMHPRSVQCAPIVGALHHDRALDRRALADGDAVLEHRAAADPRARGDPAAALDQRGRDDPARVRRPPSSTQTYVVAHARADLGRTLPSRMSNVASQVALRRPDVLPVARRTWP